MLVSAEEQLTKAFNSLFSNYAGPAFAIRLWDGSIWHSSQNEKPECTIEITSPNALELLVANPDEVGLGGAFVSGDLDVKGDIFSVFAIGEYLFTRPANFRNEMFQRVMLTLCRVRRFIRNGRPHSLNRDRSSIAHHYDQPFEFYKSWLGKSLTYSCAYFRDGSEPLDQAQQRKSDHICRKLRLQPFDQFLDIGCGWGSLVLHASKEYGAYAHGITLSKEQARVATDRIEQERLTQSCKVELRDYRTLSDLSLPFDKIASVGMFEHVGLKNLPQYFSVVHEALKPGGVFLNHGIARSHQSPARKSSFIDRYVFPDGELVTLAQALSAAESAGFEVRDVENLREHYELTLRRWVEDLQWNAGTVLSYVPKSTYRIWLLYMAGSAASFYRGDIAVYQVLLSRSDKGKSRLPLTREDWYMPDARHSASRFQIANSPCMVQPGVQTTALAREG
jgi:cyclopropane-fatty-acyl-phospholipid synthase